MISADLEGYDKLKGKLSWIRKNWPQVQRFAMMRMAESLAEELRIPFTYLHFVRVEESSERTWYGLSLEPDSFEAPSEEHGDKLFYLSPRHDAPDAIKKLAEHNPYTSDTLPAKLHPEHGVYFIRESTPEERDEVMLRSMIANDERGVPPVPSNHRQPLQDDVRYNQARGELGIGDGPSRPVWRNAVKNLIQKRLPEIVDEVSDAMISGSLRDKDLPDFEERPLSWLEDNSEFMIIAAQV